MEASALSAQERKANDDFAAGEKKAAKRSWFGGTGNKEDAAELFKSAGVAYKIAQKFDRAGEAWKKCADMHHILGNKLEECNAYEEAGKVYEQCSSANAVEMYSAAAEMTMDANRLSRAAKHYQTIGDIYEKEFEFKKASGAFKQAADFFRMEGQNSNANTCNLKVAAHSAQHLDDYDTAVKIFETVGKEAAQNNLLKYSAKKYFFHAGLCRLASDAPLEQAQLAIGSYKDYDITFSKQRECDFLTSACDAIANGDVDEFTRKITDFDKIQQLDPWSTTICLRIKKSIQARAVPNLNELDGGGGAAPAGKPDLNTVDEGDELC